MVFSHHTSSTMNNPLVAHRRRRSSRGSSATRCSRCCSSNREVVAWVNGHTHRNEITAHRRPEGGGLWEINTASHIDWPQQSRLIELADNRDGTLSIFTTMVDHAGPRRAAGTSRDSTHLAALGARAGRQRLAGPDRRRPR